MYYFKYNEKTIEKYDVSFDRDKIMKIKIDLINDCSKIVHKEYDSTSGPNDSDYLKIRNYKQTKIGYKSYNDAADETLYHYSFDEYVYPKLVTLIDRLLKEDYTVLDEIINYNIDSDDVNLFFKTKINSISAELDKIDNLDIKNKQAKIKELKSTIEASKLNESRKPTIKYYQRLISLLKYELLDTISIKEVTRVDKFFSKKLSRKK